MSSAKCRPFCSGFNVRPNSWQAGLQEGGTKRHPLVLSRAALGPYFLSGAPRGPLYLNLGALAWWNVSAAKGRKTKNSIPWCINRSNPERLGVEALGNGVNHAAGTWATVKKAILNGVGQRCNSRAEIIELRLCCDNPLIFFWKLS